MQSRRWSALCLNGNWDLDSRDSEGFKAQSFERLKLRSPASADINIPNMCAFTVLVRGHGTAHLSHVSTMITVRPCWSYAAQELRTAKELTRSN